MTPATPADAWVAIIEAAMKDPLGIIALVVLVGGGVVFGIFRSDDSRTKLWAVAIMFVFFTVFVGVAIYKVEPTEKRSPADETGKTVRLELASLLIPDALVPGSSLKLASFVRSNSTETAGTRTPLKLVQTSNCGTAWTKWIAPGHDVENPCPPECNRGNELARSFRVIGFPPKAQVRYKFQCWQKAK